MTPHNSLQLIAKLLSFESGTTEATTIITKMLEEDWDHLVTTASHHLVLPSLYCRLQQKDVLSLLPEDLVQYLEVLSQINRNRNRTLLKQAQAIGTVLEKYNIKHVFIKGIALLDLEIYDDLAERMVGDIDILVEPSQLPLASELLKKLGYVYKDSTFGIKYVTYHQDIRLLPQHNGLAAVELHRSILHLKYKGYLASGSVLSNKMKINSLFTPCHTDLYNNIILNHEINDYGYLYGLLGMRNAYDLIAYKIKNDILLDNNVIQLTKYHKSFYTKMTYYFPLEFKRKENDSFWIHLIFSLNQSRYKYLKRLYYFTVNSYRHSNDVLNRTILAITNSNYRKDLWNDRRRVLGLIFDKFK